VVRSLLNANDLQQRIESDGVLATQNMTLELHNSWSNKSGARLPVPLFDEDFIVQNQRVVGEKHLKLQLRQVTGETNRLAGAIAGRPVYGKLTLLCQGRLYPIRGNSLRRFYLVTQSPSRIAFMRLTALL